MTYVFEVLDLGSMYLLSNLFLIINLLRMKVVGTKTILPIYVGLNVVSITLLLITKTWGVYIFAAQVVLLVLLELRLLKRERPRPAYRYYLLGAGSFVLSYVFWNLDYHRIVCDPDLHWLQGHAVWHITNSAVFLCAHRFCLQYQSGFTGLRA